MCQCLMHTSGAWCFQSFLYLRSFERFFQIQELPTSQLIKWPDLDNQQILHGTYRRAMDNFHRRYMKAVWTQLLTEPCSQQGDLSETPSFSHLLRSVLHNASNCASSCLSLMWWATPHTSPPRLFETDMCIETAVLIE